MKKFKASDILRGAARLINKELALSTCDREGCCLAIFQSFQQIRDRNIKTFGDHTKYGLNELINYKFLVKQYVIAKIEFGSLFKPKRGRAYWFGPLRLAPDISKINIDESFSDNVHQQRIIALLFMADICQFNGN